MYLHIKIKNNQKLYAYAYNNVIFAETIFNYI